MEGTFLAIVDADRIQEYIFAPRQLKLIRGANAIQREVNLTYSLELLRNPAFGAGNVDDARKLLDEGLDENPFHMWEIVYAGGGNIYALFRDEGMSRRFASDVCALYRQHGGSASATSAIAPWKGSFRQTLQDAQAEVVARKTAASITESPISNPYWKICEACGLAPASHWKRNATTGERILCTACEGRRSGSERSPYLESVLELMGRPRGLAAPKDFGAIGERARPQNYLGFVYLDVDKLGRFFDTLCPFTPAKYREKSRLVGDTVRDGVIAGCAAACEGAEDGSAAPFEILLLGGDDAMVALSAQMVFPFLRTFGKVFGAKLSAENLTFSAGVVWAHSHLPVAQYVSLAKRLLRSAKGEGGGRIDYLIASESMLRGPEERDAKRTLRPYTFADFDRLSGTIEEWKRKGFPANKVHQLYGMAFEIPEQGTLDFLYWLSRLKPDHRKLACRFFQEGFWREAPRYSTAGADVAELWDFVGPGNVEAGTAK